ncbi:ThiF family adenylyltransferase [Alkalicella caledoniensis]|uniref:ThiF family adenylyltransferase n=1 Tax=Alkalicella caledoniensis TaxID=2731377 RepID=A0A7G9WA02_ALKCA|nr:ThiF family adenylyltransferase [Alkalicella caledoniensis]QNO15514.1 ThiF family adenylyltransferase [Alkalicella caledoniensis]
MYNEKVLKHFANPKNMGEIAGASGIGHTGNPSDGDKITIYIKVENDTINDIRFKTFGCAAAIAASSMLTELARGKSIHKALSITNEDVAAALGGLPPQKLKCSNIAADALHEAIADYKSKPQNESCPVKEEAVSSSCATLPAGTSEILSSNQIQRYLRQIIMPQISGIGQKKIIDTRIQICSETLDYAEVLLYYMVAMGVENITLYLEEKEQRWQSVKEQLLDFNPELQLKVADEVTDSYIDYILIIGSKRFLSSVSNRHSSNNIATMVLAPNPWSGAIRLLEDRVDIIDFVNTLPKSEADTIGQTLSNAFIGILAVTELIKDILSIGQTLENGFYYNLMECNFSDNEIIVGNSQLTSNQKEKLSNLKVLIIGAGGLGSPVALGLTKLGIGQIGLVDFDSVEITNLNRQVLHSTSRIGKLKVESAKMMLSKINPNIHIQAIPTALNKDNASELIKDYHIVVDGLDNIPTRYILNDACYRAKKPFVEAGVLTFYGQITSIKPQKTPCYRCLYPEREDDSNIPGCSELGVLGTVPGLIGILQVVEVLKTLLNIKSRLDGGLLMYDALEREFNIIPLLRSQSCSLCGKE